MRSTVALTIGLIIGLVFLLALFGYVWISTPS